MDAVTTLTQARRLLAERGWTQDVWARDSEGRSVLPTDKSAVCFCAMGAVWAATGSFSAAADMVRRYLRAPVRVAARSRCLWNDKPGRTRDEVLDVFDRAIAAAQATSHRAVLL